MELSLFSRDVIAIHRRGAPHHMFDAALMLGICDKIVPRPVNIGALAFGHLPPTICVSGLMPTGRRTARRTMFASSTLLEGKATRADLLEGESRSHHAAGTRTFYGTANTNQMLMGSWGSCTCLARASLPTRCSDALTCAAVARARDRSGGESFLPVGEVLDECAFVNGISRLMATGGSTNSPPSGRATGAACA